MTANTDSTAEYFNADVKGDTREEILAGLDAQVAAFFKEAEGTIHSQGRPSFYNMDAELSGFKYGGTRSYAYFPAVPEPESAIKYGADAFKDSANQ